MEIPLLMVVLCLIRRHNISKSVSNEMNELEYFFHSLARTHVIAPAMHYFGMEDKASKPTLHLWSTFVCATTSADLLWKSLSTTLGTFVNNYIMPSLIFSLDEAKEKDDSH